MEMYETEEQQVAAIKGWWKKNGKSVIGGAAIGFALIFGWRAYNDNLETQKESASAAYGQALSTLELDEKAYEPLQAFIDSNSGSTYASFASLKLADLYAKQGEYDKAEQQFSWCAANSDDVISSIALLRMARLQTQSLKYDEALATLAKITAPSYEAKIAEMKGGIYIAQNKADLARAEYAKAIAAGGNQTSRSLQMKFDDLAQAEVKLDEAVTASEPSDK